MKKLTLLAALTLTSLPFTASADDQIFACDLTGNAYESPTTDSYSFCLQNCYVWDNQNQQVFGECSLVPPPQPGSWPGDGSGPGGDGGGGGFYFGNVCKMDVLCPGMNSCLCSGDPGNGGSGDSNET